MPKNSKKGGGGGGDTGGGLIGTAGADRLKGNSADNTLIGYAGDDVIDGGDGIDTAVFSGSINDFDFRLGRRGIWYLTDLDPSDGDEGKDTLKNIEIVQFDDYSFNLNGDNPTVIEPAQTVVEATAGEEFSFDVSAYDLDDSVYLEIYDRGTLGDDIRLNYTTEQLAENGRATDATLTIRQNATSDALGRTDFSRGYLALGETESHTITLRAGSNSAGWTYQDIEIVFTGVNDAPTLGAISAMTVTEDGGPVTRDLKDLASDIDSDDDATSLTYVVTGLPDGVTGTISNGVLSLDPGTAFQYLEGDEFLDFTFQVRVVDQHGASSVTQDVSLRVQGESDPIVDYFNTDFSVNYGLLGLDPSTSPNLGTLLGNRLDGYPEDILSFTDGDDRTVIVSDRLQNFRDFGYDTDFDGIDNNSAFSTGGGDDHFAFIQSGTSTYLGSNEINTGAGRDVVSIDLAATASLEFVGVDISTGAGSDQIHIRASTEGIIQSGFHSIAMGSGDDLFTMVVDGNFAGDSALGLTTATNVSLGTGNDIFIMDLNVQNAVWGDIDLDLRAGDGDDQVYLDNSDTTLSASYPNPAFIRGGLNGDIHLGDGDDVLALSIHDPGANGAEVSIWGGAGNDTLMFDATSTVPFTIEDLGFDSYRITQGSQVYLVHDVEEITTFDGVLVDYMV